MANSDRALTARAPALSALKLPTCAGGTAKWPSTKRVQLLTATRLLVHDHGLRMPCPPPP